MIFPIASRNEWPDLVPTTLHRNPKVGRISYFCCGMVLLAFAMTLPAIAQEQPPTKQSNNPSPSTSASAPAAASSSTIPENPTPKIEVIETPGKHKIVVVETTGKQTKRILYVVPNFRSVSVDVVLPPQTPKQKFILMLQESFDYSSFIYVGGVAGVADAERSTPEFGHGAAAYGRYYWHSFADNVAGNLFTESLVPIATHEDPRYYTMARGGILKRSVYSVSRLFITRTDLTATNHAHNTVNISEIIGNGAGAGISDVYYPSQERTWTKTGQKWILQIGLDGGSNLVKEFWPDVNAHIFHNADW